jgi:hypothetical protein
MSIKFSEIEDAFMFVSMGQPYEHLAYLSKKSGKIYYHSEYGDNPEELPDDIDDPVYIEIPHKKELGLGKNLALEFSYKFIEQKAEHVESIFRKKGAYSKFKNLLEQFDLLEKWYAYEEDAQRVALQKWCEENEILCTHERALNQPTSEIGSFEILPNDERQKFLKNTEIINHKHPKIIECSKTIIASCNSEIEYIKKAFEYVRDEIKHSWDFRLNPVTCKASDVLKHKTGYCYSKSHLLAALLRVQKIPTGFCYQRLSLENSGPPYSLHGLNAVYLENYGWYRVDARGNKEGVNAQFTPPAECLAFSTTDKLEIDLPEIWSDPLPQVVEVLKSYKTVSEVYDNLPDIQLIQGVKG